MSTVAEMLYQHKKTGARVKIVSEWDNGEWFMVEDQDGRVYTAYKSELVPDESATKKVKTLHPKLRKTLKSKIYRMLRSF